jgi:hypothetical protein
MYRYILPIGDESLASLGCGYNGHDDLVGIVDQQQIVLEYLVVRVPNDICTERAAHISHHITEFSLS